ncbi:biopolymer transporter ExbD [Aurantivibrio infirmus]
MMRKSKLKKQGDADVDVTPLLDIVFIMLIFFIVSSTFIREEGLDVTKHQDDKKKEEMLTNAKAIIVKVCANNEIIVDQRKIDIRSVRANVERKLAEDINTVVIVETEYRAPTGSLVKVMDQARAAKANLSISPVYILCDPKEQQIVQH